MNKIMPSLIFVFDLEIEKKKPPFVFQFTDK